MKYLALIFQTPDALADYSEEDIDALIAQHGKLQEISKAEGSFIGADKLEPPTTAKTISKPKGELLISDGPFPESKEVLVGYYLFECEDIDHALRLAAQIPMAPTTQVEVRLVNCHVD